MHTLIDSFTRRPNLEDIEVGQLVMWAGLAAGALPCGLLLALTPVAGLVAYPGVYAVLLALYIGLVLAILLRSPAAGWLWRRLWLFLLAISLVCLAMQSISTESFLQPIIFITPLICAALAYPPGRAVLVGLWLLGLMNLGIALSGQAHPVAFLFPTFGYGTFMAFTFAFVRLSMQQAAARRRADRLAADLGRQRDYLAQLAAITATLTRDLELGTVLGQVAEAGRALAQAAHAHVWLSEGAGDGDLQLAAAAPPQPGPLPAEAWGAAALEQLVAQASGDRLVLPLVFKGRTIGALELRGPAGALFAGDSARLLQPFADAAAVAIENARLYEQARFSATLAERNRLARELHDTIAQGLTAVTMQLEAAQRSFERDPARARVRLGRAHELARDALEDVRRSVWTLAAPLVDGTGLDGAIDDLTARFAERTGLAVTCEHSGAAPAIDHAAATQVLRVVQEALQNVEKHARARAVLVASEAGDGVLRVLVRDDGVGFAPEAPPPARDGGGFGLLSLRERARLAGGALCVESTPGAGTQVTITITYPRSAGA